jgi:hypothetical protein
MTRYRCRRLLTEHVLPPGQDSISECMHLSVLFVCPGPALWKHKQLWWRYDGAVFDSLTALTYWLIHCYRGIQCDDSSSPLLLPSNFDNVLDLEKVLCQLPAKPSRRVLVRKLKEGSRRRHRKFIFGALYEKLPPGYRTVDLSNGVIDRVEIVVTLENGATSVVEIGSAAKEDELLKSVVSLGEVLPKTGNARHGVGDVGEMFALGYRSAKADVYVPTTTPTIADAMAAASSAVGEYMEKHWPGEYNGIRDAEELKSSSLPPLRQMGGENGPGNVIMVSRNLGNSAHIDFADKSRSFAIWVEEVPGGAQNWYFVLPDVSIGGSNGVVIKLFHGAVIAWDGSKIRHCSSVTRPGDGNNVYGCMFGSCR